MAKISTDLQQSQELAKILPIESADMWYITTQPCEIQIDAGGFGHLVKNGDEYTHLSLTPLDREGTVAIAQYKETPAWSLPALLEVIRNNGRYELEMWEGGYNFESGDIMTEPVFDAIDACVEMIINLSERGLI